MEVLPEYKSGKKNGGTARFVYYIPSEKRKNSPTSPKYRPESWTTLIEGKILFALAEKTLTLEELEKETELKKKVLLVTPDKMTRTDPATVVIKGGKYYPGIPILSEYGLSFFLPELDNIAEEIFKNVTIPHLKERMDFTQRSSGQG